jgi:hypothetical protein
VAQFGQITDFFANIYDLAKTKIPNGNLKKMRPAQNTASLQVSVFLWQAAHTHDVGLKKKGRTKILPLLFGN